MRYLSVCSGIEAATAAWHPLGFQAVAFAEIDAFPCAVLKHHYPHVPNWGDLTRFQEWPDATFDVLVGGTPCQSFSVAGLRAGLADPRGNLALTYLAVADRYRPRWLVWENVPGVLSSDSHDAPDPCQPPDHLEEGAEWVGEDEYDADESHAFACFLAGLSELGYHCAWTSLDAQYFTLAQRRLRVFVVGHLGDWRRAAAVLFERESLQGHPAPSREAREGVAGTLGGSSQSGGFRTTDLDNSGAFIPVDLRQASRGEKVTNNRTHGSGGAPGHGVGEAGDPAFTVSERGQAVAYGIHGENSCAMTSDGDAEVAYRIDRARALDTTGGYAANQGATIVQQPYTQAIAFEPRVASGRIGETVSALTKEADRGDGFPCVAFQESQSVAANQARTYTREGSNNFRLSNVAHTAMSVRRLTPRECERLQGFPDDYTLIPYRGKPAADGPRYKALGNSMAVPVMRWIGQRIVLVESL